MHAVTSKTNLICRSYVIQVTASFPQPKVCACVCEAHDLSMCSSLLCYTASKFPCKFNKDNKKNVVLSNFHGVKFVKHGLAVP